MTLSLSCDDHMIKTSCILLISFFFFFFFFFTDGACTKKKYHHQTISLHSFLRTEKCFVCTAAHCFTNYSIVYTRLQADNDVDPQFHLNFSFQQYAMSGYQDNANHSSASSHVAIPFLPGVVDPSTTEGKGSAMPDHPLTYLL